MEFNNKKQLVKTFAKDMGKGRYSTKHKCQRKEDQWSKEQKSLLIDSMLRNYPLDPIRAELKDDEKKYIFDGVQRATTICKFLNDEYKLSKDLKPVVIDGEKYEIAGKKYSELDESVKDKISDYELIVYIFSGCTDEDIREMFRRQNNGKPLSNTQKRTAIESDTVSEIIFSLADHPFFEKIMSHAQLRKDVNRDMIRETLMLINTNKYQDFTSFKTKDIDEFISWYDEHINNKDVDTLRGALDKLDESIDELKIKPTSIPMMLYAAYQCIKENKDFTAFALAVADFSNNYDSNEEYAAIFAGGGTASSESVNKRFEYWKNLVNKI